MDELIFLLMNELTLLIVVGLVFGVIGNAVGKAKGRSWGFLAGFVLGPIGLLIMALMSRSAEKEAKHQITVSKCKDDLVRQIKKLEARQVKAEGDRGEAEKEFRCWRAEEEAKKKAERERAVQRVGVRCPVCGRENVCMPEDKSIVCKQCGENLSTKKGTHVRAELEKR